MIIFYDFEVFKYDWLVVMINPFKHEKKVIVNDKEELRRYFKNNRELIWSGYNVRHYDQYIMKAILAGFDPWEMNDFIIKENQPGWKFSSLLNKYRFINYDVALLNKSLKQLEGFQGHNIHETGVDFRIDRKLTKAEIDETIKYCTNDVEEAINIWLECKSDFDAQLGLVKMFEMPLAAMSKTKAQLSAEVLECVRQERDDEWDLFTLPCLVLNNPKYKKIAQWFLNKENQDYKKSLTADVAGVPHQFGWGGLHGALEKYHHLCKPWELLLHVDVGSYYPSLMIFWNLLTRNARKPELFKYIYDYRMELKHAGKKKEQAPLKIVLNGTYGICKDKNSKAYDPRNANLICVNGQLLLLDLLEKLEQNVLSFELIQSNTDGLIIKINRKDFDSVDDICYEWESRTKMNLEFDYIKEIYQKDVNNYVFIQYDDKVERKGGYVKELTSIDNDLPIINRALVDYMLKGISPEKTIRECNDLMQFQKICKLTGKFDYVTDTSGEHFTNKCYRIFASKDQKDDAIYKVKLNGKNGEPQYFKFTNTSEKSFIENGEVKGKPIPKKLDLDWCINLAKERLEQYGMEV